MNIFAVDQCPIVSGSVLPDKVTVKMPLESAQMLSSAVILHRPWTVTTKTYKTTYRYAHLSCWLAFWCREPEVYAEAHKNHPCTIWAGTNNSNFDWLYIHAIALAEEYSLRYSTKKVTKTHKSVAIIERCAKYIDFLPVGNLTGHPQCMPDEFKHTNTQVAYKRYMASKSYFVGGFKKDVDHSEFYND